MEFYERKRDEFYRAYMAAIEMEDMPLAEKMFVEYQNYCKMLKQ